MTNMNTFNIAEAKARLSELIQKAMTGEEVIIAKDNKPVARLTAIGHLGAKRRPGTAKGRIWMAKDFDAIPPDFADYS